MVYLLDTSIISDLVNRGEAGPVARRIAELGENAVVTGVIVAAELRFGAAQRGARRLVERVEAVLALLDVLPLEVPADRIYAELRARLERQERMIGAGALLIAAQALAWGVPWSTTNDREFSRVEGLRLENWAA